MPKVPDHKMRWFGYPVLAALLAGVTWLGYEMPIVLAVMGVLIGVSFLLGPRERRRLQRIAEEREGEDIGTFARSVDPRRVDPRIIRAVYEELQKYLVGEGEHFPLRVSDRTDEDLHVDPEDLIDIVDDMAARAEVDLTDFETNPLYGKVETVGDLVLFLAHQPKKQEA